MKLLKDYDCSTLYHPGKANVVADALSRKSAGSFTHLNTERRPIIIELHELIDQMITVGSDQEVHFSSIQSTINVLG